MSSLHWYGPTFDTLRLDIPGERYKFGLFYDSFTQKAHIRKFIPNEEPPHYNSPLCGCTALNATATRSLDKACPSCLGIAKEYLAGRGNEND